MSCPGASEHTCRYFSYSGSWTVNDVTYEWTWSWGYDRDCPETYKCCDNGIAGDRLGVCTLAVKPRPGILLLSPADEVAKVTFSAASVRQSFCPK